MSSPGAIAAETPSPAVIPQLLARGASWGPLILLLAAAGAFYAAPWAPVYVPALLLVAVLTWRHPRQAPVLVILFAPLFMAPKHFGSKEFAPSELFLALNAAALGLRALDPGKRAQLGWRTLARSPFLPPLLLLLAAATVSALAAADRHHALRAWSQVIVEPAFFFALLLLVARRATDWWLYAAALVATGLLLAIISLVQLATHQDLSIPPGTTIEHVQALYGSPDNLGLFFDRVIPFWLAVLLLVRAPRTWRLAWGAVGPVFGVVLYFTGSRGAWAAVAIGCLYVLALNRRWGWPVAVACLVVAGAAAAVGGPRLARALNSGHTNTATQRLHVWSSSLRMIRDHPILGVGPDNFLHYYAPTTGPYLPCAHGLGYMESAASREPCLSHPHDEILDFWLSTGVAGLVAFLWLEVTFWRGALYAWRNCPARGARPITAGAMAAMVASLAHGLVDNSYFLIDLSLAFWLLCAMVSFFGAGRDRRVAAQG